MNLPFFYLIKKVDKKNAVWYNRLRLLVKLKGARKEMLLKLGFGVVAIIVSLYAWHIVSHSYDLMREARSVSVRHIVRTLSSLGIFLPLECFLIYVFLSYNGLNAIMTSTFFTQGSVVPTDTMLTVMAQQSFIVNALKLISAITFGSAVIFTVSESLHYFHSGYKPNKVDNEYENNASGAPARVFQYILQPAYLRIGGFLS